MLPCIVSKRVGLLHLVGWFLCPFDLVERKSPPMFLEYFLFTYFIEICVAIFVKIDSVLYSSSSGFVLTHYGDYSVC